MKHAKVIPVSSRQTLTRRDFLGGTLAATAAASSFNIRQSGAAETLAATPEKPVEFARKLKLGVVGCGGRGSWIAKLFKKHKADGLLAIVSPEPLASVIRNVLGHGEWGDLWHCTNSKVRWQLIDVPETVEVK